MRFFKKKNIPLTEFFTPAFVDIHSHLLPGIDDGAKDLEESIALVLKMRSYGIRKFITTPHVMGSIYPNSSAVILQKLAELKAALKERNITDISMRAAAEYMLDEVFTERLEKDDLLPIKAPYILVEMSYFNAPIDLYEQLFQIQLKGYKPILAHPERYSFYHQDFRQYHSLKKAGCSFQLNLLALTTYYGSQVQKIAARLLKEGLYDFVGTDVHNQRHLNALSKIGSAQNLKKIQQLLTNNQSLH
jgi:tyrosine-protein phosphatase YwqE